MVIPTPDETDKSIKSSTKSEHVAAVPKNSQGPKKLIVEIGNENEGDDSADEVASVTSARSRSRSKSRSKSRSTSSSDRLIRYIRDELITATVKTSNTESGKKSSEKAKDDESVNHEQVKQIEHEPIGDNEMLLAYDLEMKRLVSYWTINTSNWQIQNGIGYRLKQCSKPAKIGARRGSSTKQWTLEMQENKNWTECIVYSNIYKYSTASP